MGDCGVGEEDLLSFVGGVWNDAVKCGFVLCLVDM